MNNSLVIALISAIGFVIMIIFNNVHAWPLLLPLIGGIAAMAVNNRHTERKGYGTILLYGLYATLLVIVLSIPLMWFRAKDAILQQVREMGYEGSGVSFFEVASIVILSISALYFVSYLIGTALGAIFPKR